MCRNLFVALTFALAGCASTPQSTATSSSSGENYRLNTATDGHVFRINNQTGEVWEVANGALNRIGEPKAEVLQVGRKYFFENNFSMTYLGNGKFSEPVKDFSRLWN